MNKKQINFALAFAFSLSVAFFGTEPSKTPPPPKFAQAEPGKTPPPPKVIASQGEPKNTPPPTMTA